MSLRRGGTTIFLTTHNVYEAFNISDRIAIINRGRIIALGSPDEIGRLFGAREVIEVSFSPSNPDPGELLEYIGSNASITVAGDRLKIMPGDPTAAIMMIGKYALETGRRITLLNLRGADAEELFIRIIGGGK